MINLYNVICQFFVSFFTKTGLMMGKSSDIPLDAVVLSSARTDIWCRKGLMEVRVESAKLDAIEAEIGIYLKSDEGVNDIKKEAKKYIKDLNKNS